MIPNTITMPKTIRASQIAHSGSGCLFSTFRFLLFSTILDGCRVKLISDLVAHVSRIPKEAFVPSTDVDGLAIADDWLQVRNCQDRYLAETAVPLCKGLGLNSKYQWLFHPSRPRDPSVVLCKLSHPDPSASTSSELSLFPLLF